MKMDSKKAMKASESDRQQADDTPAKARPQVKKERRNRSKKRKPTDIPGLIAAIDADVLDQRVSAARDMLRFRDALASAPEPVCKALLRDALAVDALIMSRLSAELVKPDADILNEFGELHPLVKTYWPEVRGGIIKGTKALLAMEPKADKAKDEADAEAMFDLSVILSNEAKDNADQQ